MRFTIQRQILPPRPEVRARGPRPIAMAPKYEVVMLAHAKSKQMPKLKDFLKSVAHQVWSAGGVIADLKSWGSRPLAYRIRQHAENHYHAHYLGMHLYCSPKALSSLEGALPLTAPAPCHHVHTTHMRTHCRRPARAQRDYATRT